MKTNWNGLSEEKKELFATFYIHFNKNNKKGYGKLLSG